MAAHDDQITLDELADLQAGLLDPDTAADLRLRVSRDPAAAELLGALELVSAELAALPDEPIPDDVAARLDSAITAEQQQSPPAPISPTPPPGHDTGHHTARDTHDIGATTVATGGGGDGTAGTVSDLGAARRRRRYRLVQRLGVLAAAAVIAVVIVVAARPSSAPQPGSVPAYGATNLATAWPQVAESRDLGTLSDQQLLRACLTSSGASLSGQVEVLGARPVTVDGRAGVLLAFPAAASSSGPQVTLIVFDPGCGPDPVLAQATVAR